MTPNAWPDYPTYPSPSAVIWVKQEPSDTSLPELPDDCPECGSGCTHGAIPDTGDDDE